MNTGRARARRGRSNTGLPCITNDGGMIIVTGPMRSAGACAAWTPGHSTKTTQRHCGQVERPIRQRALAEILNGKDEETDICNWLYGTITR